MRLIVFCMFYFLTVSAPAGQETHGGNGFTAEFYNLFDELLEHRNTQTCSILMPTKTAFADLILLRGELIVHSAPKLELNGVEVAAINYPKQVPRKVVVSEEKWKNSDTRQRKALLIHEVLYLIGIDEGDLGTASKPYQYSSKLLTCIEDENSTTRVLPIAAFSTCDESQLRFLTPVETEKIINLFPNQSAVLNTTIINSCTMGMRVLKKQNLLNCHSDCQSWLCQMTDMPFVHMPIGHSQSKRLEFINVLLSEFQNEVNLKSCDWHMCFTIDKSDLKPYAEIQKICEKKYGVPSPN